MSQRLCLLCLATLLHTEHVCSHCRCVLTFSFDACDRQQQETQHLLDGDLAERFSPCVAETHSQFLRQVSTKYSSAVSVYISTLASLATVSSSTDAFCRPDNDNHTSHTSCEDSPAHHAQNCAAAWAQHENRCSSAICLTSKSVTAWTTATLCPAADYIMMHSYHVKDIERTRLCTLATRMGAS